MMVFTTAAMAPPPIAIARPNISTQSRQKGLGFEAAKPITRTPPPLQKSLSLKFRSLKIDAKQATNSLLTESWNFPINSKVDVGYGAQSWKLALGAATASSLDAQGEKNVQQLAKPSRPRLSRKERNPKFLSSGASQKIVLDHCQIVKYPLITDLTMREMIENNTLTFVVDKHADKNNIKAAVKKMFKIQTKKVNTLIMPDGYKKAYLMLTPNHNAVEVAKKIKII